MEKITKFEDLEVWKMSMRLTVKTYEFMRDCRDFGFRDQIQRAAVSIPSNISEEFERQTNKEFIQFLYIAKGSCGELRTQLYLAKELGYIEKPDFDTLLDNAKHISAMIFNLIQYRKTTL
ncbi:MAG: four helix bundle protein [Bacteroidales bacterium]|jgi:four helix bundle protein|nr:four helix bundle protein [Bacteroidales bacterium]